MPNAAQSTNLASTSFDSSSSPPQNGAKASQLEAESFRLEFMHTQAFRTTARRTRTRPRRHVKNLRKLTPIKNLFCVRLASYSRSRTTHRSDSNPKFYHSASNMAATGVPSHVQRIFIVTYASERAQAAQYVSNASWCSAVKAIASCISTAGSAKRWDRYNARGSTD